MPTFVKTGYWDKLSKAPKGFLNLEELIASSIGSGLPGQVAFWGASGLSGSDNLYWNNTSGRLGIGLNTPLVKLHIYDNSVGDTVYVENTGGVPSIQTYYRNNNVNPTTGGNVGALLFASYFNSTYSPPAQEIAGIFGVYLGNGTNRVGGLDFRTHDGSGLQLRIRVNNVGNVMIGGFVDGGQKLQVYGDAFIKGSGATSATNALLIQNSSSQQQYKIQNNGEHYFSVNGAPRFNIFNSYSVFSTELLIQDKLILGDFNRINIDYDSTNTIGRIRANNGGLFNALTITTLGTIRVGIGQGIVQANVSSVLELSSTTLGFLPPRMTTAQKNAIVTPAAGLVVYDTDLNKLCVFTTGWQTITSA